MNQYDRVTQLLEEYREKLTGSAKTNDGRLFDFIYEKRPRYQTELLDLIYQQAFQDGYKACVDKEAR